MYVWSRLSKAFSKSEKNIKPGMFCSSVISMIPKRSLIFSHINLPFMNPVCALSIILVIIGFILFAMAFVAIL